MKLALSGDGEPVTVVAAEDYDSSYGCNITHGILYTVDKNSKEIRCTSLK